MDYNDVKLGLIDRFKVWNERRAAEARRQQYLKDEGELLEVDYSEADKLAEELLNNKKIKKATRDAAKMYKATYGKNDDGVGKDDFIEEYLIEKGLKQKKLPEKNNHPKENFMARYSTKKSEEELIAEKMRNRPTVYYRVGDKEYDTTFIFADWCFETNKNGGDLKIPLARKDAKNFVVEYEKMNPEDKFTMNKKLINDLLNVSSGELAMMDEPSSPDAPFPKLCRLASIVDHSADKLKGQGNVEEAASRLKGIIEKIFQYREERDNQYRLKEEQMER